MAEQPDISRERALAAARPVVPATQAEKVALFGQLFRGRIDVYARRWENARTGKSGYSPHCANEWKRGLCAKPRVKCGECPNREFVPLTDRVLYQHLQGELVAGVYPLVEGDRCHFVAVDFDGAGWMEDVRAYASTARDLGLPVAIERSRSGNGAHAWFFFEAAVQASAARQLASYVLTEAMSRRSEIGMASYDRVFPNQDTLPRGGFGNLIALPLQWQARQQGNSVFVDDAFEPFANQWEFLADVQRIPPSTVERIVGEALRRGRVLGVPLAREDGDFPWAARLSPVHRHNDPRAVGREPELRQAASRPASPLRDSTRWRLAGPTWDRLGMNEGHRVRGARVAPRIDPPKSTQALVDMKRVRSRRTKHWGGATSRGALRAAPCCASAQGANVILTSGPP